METNPLLANPYAAPAADFSSGVPGAIYQPSMFALSGRIGRVRYIAYSVMLTWIVAVLVSLAVGVAFAMWGNSQRLQQAIVWLPLALMVLVAIAGAVAAKRRFNDLDLTGWCAGLVLVPYLNVLVWLFLACAAGGDEENKHGAAPAPNSGFLVAGAVLLPLLSMAALAASLLYAR